MKFKKWIGTNKSELKQKIENLYYTDYPIQGNEGHALIVVTLLAYDRNKYVTIQYGEIIDSIKSGYIYKSIDGKRKMSRKELFSLPTEVNKAIPSSLDVANELKKFRREKVSYCVWIGNKRTEFGSIAYAVNFVKNRIKHTVEDIVITRKSENKTSWSHEQILEVCKNDVFDHHVRNGSARCSGFLSKKHFRKLQIEASKRFCATLPTS